MNQNSFTAWTESAKKSGDDFIVDLIHTLIREASSEDVSDLHFQPGASGMEIWYRADGVLHVLGRLESEHTPQVVARLKVLADLLTYRTSTRRKVGSRQVAFRVSRKRCESVRFPHSTANESFCDSLPPKHDSNIRSSWDFRKI